MMPFSLYIKEYLSYDQKYYTFSYHFLSLYYSSLNLKYLKLTKMDITRFCNETLQSNYILVLAQCNFSVDTLCIMHSTVCCIQCCTSKYVIYMYGQYSISLRRHTVHVQSVLIVIFMKHLIFLKLFWIAHV